MDSSLSTHMNGTQILNAYVQQKRLPDPDLQVFLSWLNEIESQIWDLLHKVDPQGYNTKLTCTHIGNGEYSLPTDYESVQTRGGGVYELDTNGRIMTAYQPEEWGSYGAGYYLLPREQRFKVLDSNPPAEVTLVYKQRFVGHTSLSDQTLLSEKYLRYYLDWIYSLSLHDLEDAQDQGSIVWQQQVVKVLERQLLQDRASAGSGVLELTL